MAEEIFSIRASLMVKSNVKPQRVGMNQGTWKFILKSKAIYLNTV